MDTNAFTAGIEHGGLTTSAEVRMLICWLLDCVKQPVQMSVLNRALQLDGLVNYFELAHGVADLLSTGHIVETMHDSGHEPPLALTDLGRRTARTFEKKIPLNVREKSLPALREILRLEKNERENSVKIEKQETGWRLSLQIADVKSDLLTLSLYVPTEDMCISMRDRFLSDPARLYTTVVDYLNGKKPG